jgi:hypothetical protein
MPTIKKPNQHFDATLYTGNGETQTVTNAGGFQPDLVWMKNRGSAQDHALLDSIRGTTEFLISNYDGGTSTAGDLSISYNSNGFSAIGANARSNASANTYVGWQWKAGGATTVNTSGTISSNVSVNATAGFSVVTYTGNGTEASNTVGHGLGVAPAFYFIKNRSSATDWPVYHKSLPSFDGGNYPTNSLRLNTTGSLASTLGLWSAPTSTTFNIGDGQLSAGNRPLVNTNGSNYVAYCWAEVEGYSKFGSYTGNGSTDGPFLYTGFLPRFVLIKQSSSSGNNWQLIDTARETTNPNDTVLFPNATTIEGTGNATIDALSNGFKVRTTDGTVNTNASTYVFAAFAESPFKFSNAR